MKEDKKITGFNKGATLSDVEFEVSIRNICKNCGKDWRGPTFKARAIGSTLKYWDSCSECPEEVKK